MNELKKEEVWTKTPYIIKTEFGMYWFVIVFLIYASYVAIDNHNEHSNIFLTMLFPLILLLFFYRRFINRNIVKLTNEGILFYSIFKQKFIPWKDIERFGIFYQGLLIKHVTIHYKDELNKTKSRVIPLFAYHDSTLKRLRMTHEKYKDLES